MIGCTNAYLNGGDTTDRRLYVSTTDIWVHAEAEGNCFSQSGDIY